MQQIGDLYNDPEFQALDIGLVSIAKDLLDEQAAILEEFNVPAAVPVLSDPVAPSPQLTALTAMPCRMVSPATPLSWLTRMEKSPGCKTTVPPTIHKGRCMSNPWRSSIRSSHTFPKKI
jgi:hypothetical protein